MKLKKSELRKIIKEEIKKLNERRSNEFDPGELYNEFRVFIEHIINWYRSEENKDAGLKGVYKDLQKNLKIFSGYLDSRYGKGKWLK